MDNKIDYTVDQFAREKDNRIAISIAVTKSFDDKGNGTTWQTTVPQGLNEGEIAKIIDKMHVTMMRQSRWNRVSSIDSEIDTYTRQLAQLEYNVTSLLQRHPDMNEASRDIKSTYDQQRESIIRYKTLIDGLKSESHELLVSLHVGLG